MKKRLGIRVLAGLMSAAIVWSASSGVVYAKPATADTAGITETSDVSDTSAGSGNVTHTGVYYDSGAVTKGGIAAPSGLSGKGTSEDPYQISSLANLKAMSDYINYEDSADKYFSLTKDIDLSSVSFSDFRSFDDVYALVSAKATLSGNANVFFHLNGNGHKLMNLNVSLPSSVSAFGLFGFINSNSTIVNLTIESCAVYGSRPNNSAYGLLAAQNNGKIQNCTIVNGLLDLHSVSAANLNEDDYLTSLSAGPIYKGYSLVTADNNGTISGVTVKGTSIDRGIVVKGDRRFIGGVAGQNRKLITGVTVSGVRILSYGSSDPSSTLSGKGDCSMYIGMIAGRNNAGATRSGVCGEIKDSTVTLSYGADILYGDYVGGAIGMNSGLVSGVEVDGTCAPDKGAPQYGQANLYGFGRYGAIAGGNTNSIVSSGAYNVGFMFSSQNANNCYGGLVGTNSGSISSNVSTGSVNINQQTSVGVGGLVGDVQNGSALFDNYGFVFISREMDTIGALVGRNGTAAHIGQNNFWSSKVSGVSYPVPGSCAGQNDLQVTTSVINAPVGSGGVSINASSIGHSWSRSSAVVVYDASKPLSTDNSSIHVSKTSTGFTLNGSSSGAFGNFQYYVTIGMPAGVGIAGKALSMRISIPVLVTDTAVSGAGASALNPIILTSYDQFKFIKIAPSASYRMGADFAIGSDWTPVAFTGTFDGNGHTLTTNGQVFAEVSGSRDANAGASGWETGSANLASGYIYDLKLYADSGVSEGAFGLVNNATLSDVDYTASGNGIVHISAAKGGALADVVSGNVLIRDCQVSVPVTVAAAASEGIGAVVGQIAADVFVMDNCGSSSPITLSSNLNNIGGLVGSVAALSKTGVIRNSYASGSVTTTSGKGINARVFIGDVSSAANKQLTVSNCYYSVFASDVSDSVATRPAPLGMEIEEFSFAERSYNVPLGGKEEKTITLTMPADVDALRDPSSSDFEVSFSDDCVSLTTPVRVSGSTVSFGVSSSEAQTEDFSTTLTVLHKPSGLKAHAALGSGIRALKAPQLVNGSCDVTCEQDLIDISNSFSTYKSATINLKADLDFTGLSGGRFPMASTNTNAFKGSFIGANKGDGTKYTISNLTIDGSSNSNDSRTKPTALFGYAQGAAFQNFALDHITVTNAAYGAAVLVGFADGQMYTSSSPGVPKATTTVCSFNGIEITNCTVTSTHSETKIQQSSVTNWNNNTSLNRSAKAGALIGAAWSGSTTADYLVQNILVQDTTVQNTTAFSFGIGGLVGEIYTTNTFCIGASGADYSVTMDNVTVTGSTMIGGIVGKAGGMPTALVYNAGSATFTSKCVGQLMIQNVQVKDSSVHAFYTSDAHNGIAGGILGFEKVALFTDTSVTPNITRTAATIKDSVVQNTSVVSDNVTTVDGEIGSDAGGIAGHMSGSISGCTVRSCTIRSCLAGGVVGSTSNRYVINSGTGEIEQTESQNRSMLYLTNCNVLGNTVITRNNYASALCCGGLIGSLKNGTTKITGCGVGNSVSVGSHSSNTGNYHVQTAGGISAYTNTSITTNNPFTVDIEDCTMCGDVQILESDSNSDSCVGGIIGKTERKLGDIAVRRCVVTGGLNNQGNYVGGVFGHMTDYSNASSTDFIVDCTIVSLINQNPAITPDPLKMGKLIGRLSDTVSGWMNTPGDFIHGNIVSSYPQDCKAFGSSGANISFQDTNLGQAFSDSVALTFTDVNKPNAKYIHDSSSNLPIDASVSLTASIVASNMNTAVITSQNSNPPRLAFDDQFGTSGWTPTNSAVLNIDSVASRTPDPGYTIGVTVSANGSAGVSARYSVYDFASTPATVVVPGTANPIYVEVCIPVTVSRFGITPLTGYGTQASPYLIRTKAELDSLHDSSRDLSKYYAVAQDIEFTSGDFGATGAYNNNGKYFVPIGYQDNGTIVPFSGHFTTTYNGNTYHIKGLQMATISPSAGLFAESTSSAVFEDIDLQNFTVSSSTGGAGALVGKATGTTFTNIEISDSTVSGSSYAGGVAAYASDVTATGVSLSGIRVDSANHVGGVFGHAHRTSSSTTNTVSVDLIHNLTLVSGNTTTSGVNTATAGGVAGQFSGEIQEATFTGTGSISGAIAGGVVGKLCEANDYYLAQASQTAVDGTCTIGDVNIGGNYTITSNITSAYAAAGGIVGKLRQNSNDNQSGVVSLNLTVSDCTVGSGVSVNAYFFAGGILGNSDSSVGSISIEDSATFAEVSAVSENNSSGTAGAIAAHVYDLDNFSVASCIASGSLTAVENLGGVVGHAEGALVTNNDPIVIDTVVSCTLTFVGSQTQKSGIVFGNIADATLIDQGTPRAGVFSHIYYSSYQIESSTGVSGSANINTAYGSVPVDVNNMTYNGGRSFTLSGEPIVLNQNSIQMGFTYVSGGHFDDFTVADNVDFDLVGIVSKNDNDLNLFTFTDNQNGTYTLTVDESGDGYAVLTYSNGIEVPFSISAISIIGAGTQANPYVIEKVKDLSSLTNAAFNQPNTWFALGRDIDFDTDTDGATWLSSTWNSNFSTSSFKGILTGMYYPYDTDTETYDTTATMERHAIKNLTLSSSKDFVGFFSTLPAGATVRDIDFIDADITGTSTAGLSGTGVVAGLNNGTITGVKVYGSGANGGDTSYAEISGVRHVGSIAGVSFGTVTDCQALLCDVSATHCAGGIVGGGSSVTNCTVSSSIITADEIAGGILGGNMKYDTSGSDFDSTSWASYKSSLISVEIRGCSVSASTVQSRAASTVSYVGGILGSAEVCNPDCDSVLRSITVENCTVGTASTNVVITANANSQASSTTKQDNYAGGVIAFLEQYYEKCVIDNCKIYADITANGSLNVTNSKTSAGGLLASTQNSEYYFSLNDFSFSKNIISGSIASSKYAGGIGGRWEMRAYTGIGTDDVDAGDFISGNIIACVFKAHPDIYSVSAKPTVATIGAFFGACRRASDFIDSEYGVSNAIKNNYYSSYVSCEELDTMKAFGTNTTFTSGVNSMQLSDGVGVFDVAQNSNSQSSFQVKNHREDPSTHTVALTSDFEEIVIGYHFSEQHPSTTYEKPVSFLIANNSNSNFNDLALSSSTALPVCTVAGEPAREISLQSITLGEGLSDYYSLALTTDGSGRTICNLTIKPIEVTEDSETVITYPGGQGELVADLGYGLKVALKLSNDKDGVMQDGSSAHPYEIKNAVDFVHYFFSTWSDDSRNHYLRQFYLQKNDINFDDVLTLLYNNNRTFAPIGADGTPFCGCYNGGNHTIKNFGYSGTEYNVGLFGLVSDEGATSDTPDARLKNLHIEIRENEAEIEISEGVTVTAVAGVTGKYNVGGLVGQYQSAYKIYNCSVAYGTVRSPYHVTDDDKNATPVKEVNVGGLVGCSGSLLLDGCFASTEVRVFEDFLTSAANMTLYAAGGLIGACSDATTAGAYVGFNRCFCSSDVLGIYHVSGFIGKARQYISLNDCASTATVTALYSAYTAGTATTPDNPSLLIGKVPTSSGWIRTQSPYVSAHNVYVAGLDATSFSVKKSTDFYYPVLFGNAPLVNEAISGYTTIMTQSDHVFYDANAIGRISLPNESNYWNVMVMSGDVYDSTVSTKQTNANGNITNCGTSDLTSTSFSGLSGSAWDAGCVDLYPVLKMYDKYSNAFATLSALPVHVDPRETDDQHMDWDDGQRQYSGVTYPTSIATTIQDKVGISSGDGTMRTLTVVSSSYSESNDTYAYDARYDVRLQENGLNPADMKADFLFDKPTDNEILILRNSYLNCGASLSAVNRNERAPKITVSTTLGSIVLHRDIRIGLRSSPNAVYVATERQLRAIRATNGGSGEGGVGTKFYEAYNGATSKNIRICADIELNGTVPFDPISGFVGGDSSGDEGKFGFDGSGCQISNLYISKSGNNNVGMFDSLSGDSSTAPRVKNVILYNVSVTGANNVGALAGSVTSAQAYINNCKVINDDASGADQFPDHTVRGVTGSKNVGGLVGSMTAGKIGYTPGKAAPTTNQATGAKVNVKGVNFVGGLVGWLSDVQAANCFATGNVTLDADTVTSGNCAVGGFAGYASKGTGSYSILYAFASGNVTANANTVQTGALTSTQFGIGGFVGVADITISNCFSSGDVVTSVQTYTRQENRELIHAIGGLVGYSESGGVSNSYSSSFVRYAESGDVVTYDDSNPPAITATHAKIGVGGVVGYSSSSKDTDETHNTVDHCYSSGSIRSSKLMAEDVPVYIGGVVGYSESGSGYATQLYFDKWTNNIVDLKAVGNLSDVEDVMSGDTVTSYGTRCGYTTDDFCEGHMITGGQFSSNTWGYDAEEDSNTYPYLKAFCNSDVSDYVRYPAVLSVIAVRPNDRDTSALDGSGYTMALTMPTSVRMKYYDVEQLTDGNPTAHDREYFLEWDAEAQVGQGGSNDNTYAGGLIQYGHNTFAPYRTSNTRQNLQLVVYVKSYIEDETTEHTGFYDKVPSNTSGALEVVKDNYPDASFDENSQIKYSDVSGNTKDTYTPRVGDHVKLSDGYKEYGTRKITKLYRMMLGTEEYPYLISSSLDLAHISFTVSGSTISNPAGDYGSFEGFYDDWYSPIDSENVHHQGKVHFKLISNIDMTTGVSINGTTGAVTVSSGSAPVSVPAIVSMAGNSYPYNGTHLTFEGIVIDGDDYAIVNYSDTHPFITELDAESEVKNLLFDGAAITTSSNAAALIGTNKGTIDGLMLMDSDVSSVTSAITSGSGNAAGLVADNQGTIRNSVSAAAITTTSGSYIGGIAAVNSGLIESCVSNSAVTAEASTTGAGGIVGKNDSTAAGTYSGWKCYAISTDSDALTVVANDATLQSGQIHLEDVVPARVGYTARVGDAVKMTLCHVQVSENTSGALKIVANNATLASDQIHLEDVVSSDFTPAAGDYVLASNATGLVRNSISAGSVTGGSNANAGGFVGENAGLVQYAISRAVVSGAFEKAGSFAGANSGTIMTAFSAGNTTISGTTAASKGSAFVGINSIEEDNIVTNGVLDHAFADKALLGSNTYMLIEDAEVTENIISGAAFRSGETAFSFGTALSGNGYPEISAIKTASGTTVQGTHGVTYKWLKYQLLQGYSTVASRTIDSVAAQYVDTLTTGESNVLTNLDTNVCSSNITAASISSGSGTVTTSLKKNASQKIGAGNNTKDDLNYVVSYGFDYACGNQNSSFSGGTGNDVDHPYIIEEHTVGLDDTYTVQDSFASLAYYGKATDAYFKLNSDVPYGGGTIVPIEAMNGNLDGNGYTVSDLDIGNNAGLFGKLTGSVSNLGLTGVYVSGSADDAHTNFGLLAGESDLATLENVYAVGELKVAAGGTEAVNVGGLIGYAKGTTASGIVTSGYIRSDVDKASSTVGGVFGKMEKHVITEASEGVDEVAALSSLEDAVSTAYVYGLVNVGGIIGNGVNGSIADVRFAGQIGDENKTTYPLGDNPPAAASAISHIMAIGAATVATETVGSQTVQTAKYDRQLALFKEMTYPSMSTAAMAEDTVFENHPDTDYYPNPISVSTMSGAFEAGLNFALARIPINMAGTEGGIGYYTGDTFRPSLYSQISVISSVYTNGEDEILDSVSLTEDRTRFGTEENPDTNSYMNQASQTSLTPDGGSHKGFTGIRAELDRGTGKSYALALDENNQDIGNAIYRYLEVKTLRVIYLEYVIARGTGVTTTNYTDNQMTGVMVRSDVGGISANAMTNIASDYSNDQTVQFMPIIASGDLYVDTMLPQGFKASVTSAEFFKPASTGSTQLTTDTDSKCGVASDGKNIKLGDNTTKVRFTVTISQADPVWGLRTVTGGIQ